MRVTFSLVKFIEIFCAQHMKWMGAIPEIESGDLMMTILCFEAKRFPLYQIVESR